MSLLDPFTTPRPRIAVNPSRPAGRSPGRLSSLPGQGAVVLLAVSVATALTSVALVAGTGLSVSYGFAVFAVFALVAALVTARLPRSHPHHRFGWANGVTLVRAGILALIAGLAVQPAAVAGASAALWLWAVVAAALFSLALDGVDGFLARRQGTCSAFGARFDMEVDAGMSFALAAILLASGLAGPWVLLLGGARYLFVAGTVLRTAWRRPLPASWRRKTVCVLQIAGLFAALVPVLPDPMRGVILAFVGLAVAFSFLTDVVWLETMERRSPWTDEFPSFPALVGLLRSLLVYHGQVWRTRALDRHYRDLIPAGSLCFDIGAHVGNRTLAMRRRGGRVVAVEPQPLFHALLSRLLPRDRVGLRQVAVCDAEGEVELAISSRHPTVTTAATDWRTAMADIPGFEQVAWDRSVRVPATTLDRLIAEEGTPYFVKIDVEGLEPAILAGLSVPVPLLAFEFIPGAIDGTKECLRRLQALGPYRFNITFGENHRLEWAAWRDAEAVLETIAALPPGSLSGDIYARLIDAA